MKYWKKISHPDQKRIIGDALAKNINYRNKTSLGVPGSRLDNRVFYDQASFLPDSPFLQSIVQNPNHIGCHTLGESEPYFAGTQEIEREVIQILAEDIFKAQPDTYDGYIATGGTEANIQACWMHRNMFMNVNDAKLNEIALIASEDTHYSVSKASDLLQLDLYSVRVHFENRRIDEEDLQKQLDQLIADGKKYCIIISNLGTTMFGSIDDPDLYARNLEEKGLAYKIHLDGAFGGFIYPIVAAKDSKNITFENPVVSSITLDAHKMLQAPYGTGVFLTRKNLIQNVFTQEAQYVNGMDITLAGSRSGANAIAVWMILQTYGPFGWFEKMNTLLYRTNQCCNALDSMGVRYFRQPNMNIIAIQAKDIPKQLAEEFGLVPDTHTGDVSWQKMVIMEHVEMEMIEAFLNNYKAVMERISSPLKQSS